MFVLCLFPPINSPDFWCTFVLIVVIINVCVFVCCFVCFVVDLSRFGFYVLLFQIISKVRKYSENVGEFRGVLLSFLSSTDGLGVLAYSYFFILDDTLAISANNKWSDERLWLTKPIFTVFMVFVNKWTDFIEFMNGRYWKNKCGWVDDLNCFKLN